MIKNGNLFTNYSITGLFCVWLIGALMGCQQSDVAENNTQNEVGNPPAEGFDMINSHPVAIEIADKVMEAMGGRSAWDSTRYISWNFFGSRHLIWDKQAGNVRIDFPDSTVYQVNIFDGSGRVFKQNEEVINPDSLAKELDRAKRIWINDSYWLVMPFKLKDSGVTLKHLGTEETLEGVPSNVLELTFKEVGVTPENRYLVYVDTATNLVNQWAYYKQADQDSANFVIPWRNYQEYRGILLSDNRGQRQLSEVAVYETLPEQVFTTLDQIDLSSYQ
jgi:hypothetical protein